MAPQDEVGKSDAVAYRERSKPFSLLLGAGRRCCPENLSIPPVLLSLRY